MTVQSPPKGSSATEPNALASAVPTAVTPSAVAADLLSALSPSTVVSTGRSTTVAGQPAYELVLSPKAPTSLIGSVRIAIDATHHVPLRVEVYAVGDARKPAFELGYSQISFTTPDAAVFGFNPPPGVTTRQIQPDTSGADPAPSTATAPRVIGSGWTAIVSAQLPTTDTAAAGQGDKAFDAITKDLPTVSGPWGTGKVIITKLFSALLTTTGRVYAGAVSEDALLAAATTAAK
jgi:hypothetical protein